MELETAFGLIAGVLVVSALAAGLVERAPLSFPMLFLGLGFLIGDRTLVVRDQGGGVSSWQLVPPPGGGERRLTRIYEFAGHAGPVVTIDASKRDKGFAVVCVEGPVHRVFTITDMAETLQVRPDREAAISAALSPDPSALA